MPRSASRPATRPIPSPTRRSRPPDLAERLASTLDGEVVTGRGGRFVRVEGRSVDIAVDRARLAGLPGQPPADRPLVCLDTETTGLATAAGTVAFLIGLGWWEGDAVPPGPAAAARPRGRGGAAGRARPAHPARCLARDLQRPRLRLAVARRALPDGPTRRAQSTTGTSISCRSCGACSGTGWTTRGCRPWSGRCSASCATTTSTAGRSRGATSGSCAADRRSRWPRSCATTTRTSARWPASSPCWTRATPRPRRAATPRSATWRASPARSCAPAAPRRRWPASRRSSSERTRPPSAVVEVARPVVAVAPRTEVPWWSPQARADFGGPPRRRDRGPSSWHRTAAFAATWDAQRVALDRAHLLRRVGRYRDAAEAWAGVAAGPGRTAIVAWIELAKLREHRLGDPAGALEATLRGRRGRGRPRAGTARGCRRPALEAGLRHRLARLSAAGLRPPRPARRGPARPAPRASGDRTVPASRT